MSYLSEIKNVTEKHYKEIEEIKKQIKQKEIEFTKEYFKNGDRVVYSDRDGNIEGIVIAVDDKLRIVVMIDRVNGEKWNKSISTFEANQLEIIRKRS